MRKILIALALALLVPAAALGFIWEIADQASVSWDPVNATSQGAPIPASEVEYEVFLVGADEPKEARESLGRTNSTEYTITFDAEGNFLAGVRSLRVDNGTVLSKSTISWSDDAEVVAVEVFGFRFYWAPQAVTGLQKQQEVQQ
jgi:hypothetical protein